MMNKKIKDAVKARYSQIAERREQSCCASCGCGISPITKTEAIGYSREDLGCIPEEALMGLGCGNPTAIAELKSGETVLDLGYVMTSTPGQGVSLEPSSSNNT